MANEPSQYPNPVSPGGMREGAGTELRALRSYLPPGNVRQPDLGQAPQVVSISGFGSAGQPGPGASVRHYGQDADQSCGLVEIWCGLNPTTSGTIVLRFPVAPSGGQYVVFGDWLASAALGVAGNNLTITWTANGLVSNQRLRLAYQWAVSS